MVQANNAEEVPDFRPEPALIKQMTEELKANFDQQKNLAANQAIGAVDAILVCPVCQLIVEDPMECNGCSQLSCAKCYREYCRRSRSNTCTKNCAPNFPVSTANVNRFVRDTLNALTFRCDKCQQQFTFEGRQQHWNQCGVKYACTQESCGLFMVDLESMENLQTHWINQCESVRLQCSVCHGNVKRENTADHNCDPMLRGIVKHLRIENDELKERVKALEQEVQNLKGVYPQPVFPGIDPYPVRPHPRPIVRPNPRPVPRPKPMPIRPAPVVKPVGASRLACLQNHLVQFLPSSHSKSKHWGDSQTCRCCRQQFSVMARGGYYSCNVNECTFAMCVKCARCQNGHQLVQQVGDPKLGLQRKCDRCTTIMSVVQMNGGFSRCDKCDFDVCRECIPDPSY